MRTAAWWPYVYVAAGNTQQSKNPLANLLARLHYRSWQAYAVRLVRR